MVATRRFDREAKDSIFIGYAEIRVEDCLLSENKECDRCKAACPYNAITIEAGEKEAFRMQPVVSMENCVGCGACMIICPPEIIDIVPSSSVLVDSSTL